MSSEIGHVLNAKSVLVIDDERHWLSIVEVKNEKAFVACSAVWQENPRAYKEAQSPRFKRPYNCCIEESSKLRIHRALLVRK